MKNQLAVILTLLIAAPIVIFFSRQMLPNNYLASSIYKLIFLFPIFYRVYVEKKVFRKSVSENFSTANCRKNFPLTISVGGILTLIYLSSFFLFRDYLDLDGIASKLQSAVSLNINNLIFIGLYIVLINSLLEEFFWRGFIFVKLEQVMKSWQAHAISGLAFSLHHIMFYYSWFDSTIFLLVTLGLVGYAIIMNFVFKKCRDLFSCWLVHVMVDVVQIFIAFQCFLLYGT